MYLRRLKQQDAQLMLEWMHDKCVTGSLHTNFAEKTIADCERFIEVAQGDEIDAHYAIASEKDEYMGTVSLKHIDRCAGTAEFAITVRREAMGKGYAWYGMKAILEKAFTELCLNTVYWCVFRSNIRAVRFYDKHLFREAEHVPSALSDRYPGETDLKWYAVGPNGCVRPEKVAGCRVVRMDTHATEDMGALCVLEAGRDVPFEIRRMYYVTGVPEGGRRGFHAHRKLKQLIFCPYGRVQLILENETGREEIELCDPSTGVLIEKPTWREMLWLQKDSVLCVAASEYYDADDYIRDHAEFTAYIGGNR